MKHLIQMFICRTRSKFRRYKRIRSIRFKTSLITFKSIEAIEVAIVLTRINSKIILQEAPNASLYTEAKLSFTSIASKRKYQKRKM